MLENLINSIKHYPILESSTAHVALALVLDISGSMQGEKIDSLNNAINNMIAQIKEDARLRDIVDLAVFVFGEEGRDPVCQGFRAISDCGYITLQANDNETWVSNALDTAVDRLRERTNLYAQGGGAYKPWLILITDGQFFDGEELNTIASKMKQRESDNKLQFFGLGVQGYDRGQLEMLTNRPNHVIDVKAVNFVEFFCWYRCNFAVDELEPLVFRT